MTREAYDEFSRIRRSFLARVAAWNAENPALAKAQTELGERYGHAPYAVETSVVYNGALDGVTEESDIRMVLVADNPGIQEQKAMNRSYLVGMSGKLAARFFAERLGIDFRSQVVILNKTPVHTPRTAELKGLSGFRELVEASQEFMGRCVVDAARALDAPLWIVGYSELARGKIFEPFSRAFVPHAERSGVWDSVFLFRHFSMNQFSIDLKAKSARSETVPDALERIGKSYRDAILGPYRAESPAGARDR